MKKTLKMIMAAAGALLLLSFAGCKTTEVAGSGIKGKTATVKNVKRQIADYQGATLGSEIPQWVKLVSEGQYGQKVLSKVMPDLEGRKVFVVTGRGDNLDFVKSWVNLVDIETEVSGALERVTGKVVTSKLEGANSAAGSEYSETEVNKALNDYRIALQDVRISGLEREAEYWTLIEVLDKKKNVVDSYYEYYTVWSMDQKVFNVQLEKALEHIDEATTEAAALKQIVKEKLENELSVASNSPEAEEEADSYIVYAE
ncbi:MAG: hypothetical protein K6C97_06110 [Treponema sp.]|nr:hypothetical protein [Treponema sp.]